LLLFRSQGEEPLLRSLFRLGDGAGLPLFGA